MLSDTPVTCILRKSGTCKRCERKVEEGISANWQKSWRCQVHGHLVSSDSPACTERRVTNGSGTSDTQGPRRDPPSLAGLLPPTCCERCGSSNIERDDDGWRCWACGWHRWDTARQGIVGHSPDRGVLTYFPRSAGRTG